MNPSLRGMGRLWPIQGVPVTMPHGMVETPHGADFSFLFSSSWSHVLVFMLVSSSIMASNELTWPCPRACLAAPMMPGSSPSPAAMHYQLYC